MSRERAPRSTRVGSTTLCAVLPVVIVFAALPEFGSAMLSFRGALGSE